MNIPVSSVESRSVQETYAEGLRYFMGKGTVNNTLAQLSADLKQNGIGAVALMAYGYPRFTEDIDLVLTPEGLDVFHKRLKSICEHFRNKIDDC